MSNYVYVAKDFNALSCSYENGANLAAEHLGAMLTAEGNLSNSKSFQGATADAIKSYLEDVYPMLYGLLMAAIEDLYNGFDAYHGKYASLFGSTRDDYEEHVSSGELDQIKTKITDSVKVELNKIDPDFQSQIGTLHSNGDINFSYKNDYYTNVLTGIDGITTQLTNWVEGMNGIEGSSSEFDAIKGYLSKITSILNYMQSVKPSSYDRSEFGALIASLDIASSYEAVVNEAKGRETEAQKARQLRNDMLEQEQLDEIARREKEAATIGLITDIVCTVAVVAATAVAGPVGAVVVGGLAGAARSAIHEGLDQYAATGATWGQLDWNKIGIKALVGGITGAATSAIGVGAGQLTNLAGGIASPLLKTGANMLIGIGKNELNTLVDHGGNWLSTGLIGMYEGDANAWSKAGDVFVADLGKDSFKAAFTGVTSNLSGFTDGMSDGFKKSGINILISGGTGLADYSMETALDGKEWNWREAVGSAGKEMATTTFSEGVSNLKDKYGYNAWMQKDEHNGGKYVIAFASGGAEEYIKKNGGAYVEALIKGDKDAAENLKFFDKDGKPTSAFTNIAAGGTQATAKNYYDKNLAPGTKKEETIYKTDENGKQVLGEDGKPIAIGTRTTTNYGAKKMFGQKKIVAETYTTVEQGKAGQTTTTEKTTYYENGKQIGEGTKTTTSGTNAKGETTTTVKNDQEYTRKDHTTVETHTKSSSRYDQNGNGKTTESGTTTTTTDKHFDHKQTTVSTSSESRTKDGVTETSSDKYEEKYNTKKDEYTSLSESHSDKTTYKVGEGDKAVEHTVTSERSTTVSKNDIGKGIHTETRNSNKSEIDGKRTATHTHTTKETEGIGNHVSTRTQDVNTKTYETKKVDDKLATGRIKTNVGIGGTYSISDEVHEAVKADVAKDMPKPAEDMSAFGQLKSASDLHLNGW